MHPKVAKIPEVLGGRKRIKDKGRFINDHFGLASLSLEPLDKSTNCEMKIIFDSLIIFLLFLYSFINSIQAALPNAQITVELCFFYKKVTIGFYRCMLQQKLQCQFSNWWWDRFNPWKRYSNSKSLLKTKYLQTLIFRAHPWLLR